MLSDQLKVVDGAAAGAWIKPGLGGAFGAVSLQVPKIFEAYARVFHRALDSDGNNVTWAEVARRLGRTAHREMQWHQLVGSSDSFAEFNSKWTGGKPSLGNMQVEELDRLCAALGTHSADPDHCFFGLCVINSRLSECLSAEEARLPQLELPLGRDHVVMSGPLSAVDQIVNTDTSGVWSAYYAVDEEPPSEPPEPDFSHPFWREAPHLIWPADRSWLVVSEVDFDSTLVGGTRELVEALVANPELEVYEVEPETSLAAFSDKVNWVPEPGPRDR
jgi:hypothetical protein